MTGLHPMLRKFTALTLLALLSLPVTFSQAQAQSFNLSISTRKKMAADLDKEVARAQSGSAAAQLRRVLVRPKAAAPRRAVPNKLARLGGKVRQMYKSFNLLSAELSLGKIRELAADANVEYIAPDREVRPSGLLEETTGAAQIRNRLSTTTLDGRGIGIAVIDSGLYSAHSVFARSKATSVVLSRDFTGANLLNDDIYGHGSHVATLAGGAEAFADGAYTGIAPGADLLNLRVLDANGRGSASTVIAALDWCIQNKLTYNIRVINLSLGTAPVDSYKDDPLCLAARRAYDAGIVVVAAAGNLGKDANGNKIYGGINSPGIDPSVITVGAANTFGTMRRSDDGVTTFSSRGPTRGYWTDAQGVRHYDNLIKPDLVAPGNKVIAAQSLGSTSGSTPNTLIQIYPELDTGATAVRVNKTMYLSGTSMSAPLVTGTAALLLQANPTLTPGLVKAILMYTAQPLRGFNTLEQGAGLLNIDGAIRMAQLIKPNASLLTNGTSMLNGSLPNPQASQIAGETCAWGQGIITNHCFLYGSRLMQNWHGMYSPSLVLADATMLVNGMLRQTAGLIGGGVSTSQGALLNTGIVMADGTLAVSGIVMADGVSLACGIVMADGIVRADGTAFPDGWLRAKTTVWGDDTAAMQPVLLP